MNAPRLTTAVLLATMVVSAGASAAPSHPTKRPTLYKNGHSRPALAIHGHSRPVLIRNGHS